MEGLSSTSTMLPPGFRFHPTDEELVACYLISKISNPSSTGMATLVDVDLNRCEPWDLPGKAKIGENEWYFFSHRHRKYPTGSRTNRATKTGYWKTTGKDKEIFSSIMSELIGMKKTLVFYQGRAPRGEKTDWVMHEFRLCSLPTFPSTKEEWVICRVFQKSSGAKKYHSNYNLEFGPFMEKLESHEPGSSHYGGCGPNTNAGREAVIPALKLPQTIPSRDVASSIYAGSRFDSEMGFARELDDANNAQRSGYSGFEGAVDLHTYWSPFC